MKASKILVIEDEPAIREMVLLPLEGAEFDVTQAGDAEEALLKLADDRATAAGEVLEMGPTEFRIPQVFMSHPERVFSRSRLLDHAWGHHAYIEERTVDVHILRLRQALREHGCRQYIQTVRGVGYRLSERG